jgi:hypothetical protein
MALQKRASNHGNSNNTAVLKRPRALLEHNGNVIMALSEVALLGGLPVRFVDFCVAPLFGLAHLLFAWFMMNKWSSANNGPQVIYFFLDTTLGYKTSVFLLVLLLVLTIVYGIFAGADFWVRHHGDGSATSGILVNLASVLVILSLVCRFRD